MLNQKALLPAILLLVAFSSGAAALAAPPWVEQGPGPILNGANTEGMPGPNPVAGAINAIVPSPSSADIVFVGTVNGGVWKTSNATAVTPTWTPLTDTQLPALSIDSLAMSPANPNTLFAGTGSTSSFGFNGSPGFGVARSTDGGTTWTVLAAATFTGRAITSIVPTTLSGGNVVLAATLRGTLAGVYRSTDNGVSFTRISGNGTSGLPDAGVSQLIADPGDATGNRFYAGVPQAFGGGAAAGVYRSVDGGVTWTAVNTNLTGLATSLRILLAIHNDATNNVIYADIINTGGTLSGVFRSTNQGGSWTSLGVPAPSIYPGAQGSIHGALAADPTSPNVVFISGDRQDSPFPNVNGCLSFSANTFRYTGTAWENIVCNGAHATSPHADSRGMQFDANGNLLQTCDGGIYRLVSPNTTATRQWVPVVGNIRPTEYHSVAFDPLSKVTLGGAQDNGTAYQLAPGGFTGNELFGGDGGAVAIDADQVAHPGTTLRYNSSQNFGLNTVTHTGNFNRATFNAANNFIARNFLGVNITAGAGAGMTLYQFDPNIQFFNPYVLNAIDPSRMLIGTANLYESTNRGDSLNNLGFAGAFFGSGSRGQPLAYGGRLNGVANANVFYAGAGTTIFHRVSGSIVTLPAYPGGTVRTIVMNPQNYRQVFVADTANKVWGSFDEGASWIDLTANLSPAGSISPPLTSQVATIEVFSPDQTIRNTVLIAGGFGAFEMRRPGAGGAIWTPLSTGIPNALVQDLHYDYSNDVLVAGSLGRGSWTLSSFFRGGGGTGSALVAAASTAPSLPAPSLDLPPVPSDANMSAPDTPRAP